MKKYSIMKRIARKRTSYSTSNTSSEEECCIVCNKKSKDMEEVWYITCYKKIIPTIECPQCGKDIQIYFKPEIARIVFNKPCSCNIELSQSFIEDKPQIKWERGPKYYFCKEDFIKLFGEGIAILEL